MASSSGNWRCAHRSSGNPADVELADQLRVVEHIDRYGAIAHDRKGQHRERTLAIDRDHASGTVDQRGTHGGSETPGAHRSTRDPFCTEQFNWLIVATVGTQHPIRVEHSHQRLYVALSGGGEVSVYNRLLTR
jgi:hypothetical protein